MKKQQKNNKKFFKRIISLVLANTIMFTSIPPVKIDLPKWNIHFSLFDSSHGSLFDRASLVTEAVVVNPENDEFNYPLTNGVRNVTINRAIDLVKYSICYEAFPGNNHNTDHIEIAITEDIFWDLLDNTDECIWGDYGGFRSIGNDTCPFEGTNKALRF